MKGRKERKGKGETRQSGLLNLLVPSRGDKDEWERRKEGKNTGPRIPTIDVGSSLARSGEKGTVDVDWREALSYPFLYRQVRIGTVKLPIQGAAGQPRCPLGIV